MRQRCDFVTLFCLSDFCFFWFPFDKIFGPKMTFFFNLGLGTSILTLFQSTLHLCMHQLCFLHFYYAIEKGANDTRICYRIAMNTHYKRISFDWLLPSFCWMLLLTKNNKIWELFDFWLFLFCWVLCAWQFLIVSKAMLVLLDLAFVSPSV